MIRKINFLIMFVVGFCISCAHYKNIKRTDDDKFILHVRQPSAFLADGYSAAAQSAIAEAQSFCDDKYSSDFAITQEKLSYVGKMSEADYKKTQKAILLGSTAGAGLMSGGGKTESSVGTGLFLLSTVAAISQGAASEKNYNGYIIEMKFICQKNVD